jgi:hypothetical protein
MASVGDAPSRRARSNRSLPRARMAYLPTRDSNNMMNGMYAAQKIIKKAIFFTEHETICIQCMIDGRMGLFVLAGIFPYPWSN